MSSTKRIARLEPRRAWGAGFLAAALLLAACGDADNGATDAVDDEAAEPAADDEDAGTDDVASFDEEEFTFASYIPQSVAFGVALDSWMDKVEDETDGAVTFDAHYDGSLYTVTELRDAVIDGRVDVAHFSAAYFPNEFPLTTASHVPFLTDNLPAQMATFNQLYEENEQYRAEFEDQGLVLLQFIGVQEGIVTSPEPIDSLDYFQTASNRASADFVSALEAIGASEIVTLPTNELYEALERGLADTVVGFTLDVGAALSLVEVTPYFVDVGAGQWADTVVVMREDTWNGLQDATRTVMTDAMGELPDEYVATITDRDAEACEQVLDGGGEVLRLPEDEIERWRDAAEQPLADNWAERAGGAGVADPERFFDEYLSVLADKEAEFDDFESGMELCMEQSS